MFKLVNMNVFILLRPRCDPNSDRLFRSRTQQI